MGIVSQVHFRERRWKMDLNVLILVFLSFSAGAAIARLGLAKFPVPSFQRWMLGIGILLVVASCIWGATPDRRGLQFGLPPAHPAWALAGATLVALAMVLLVLADVVREHKARRPGKVFRGAH
jgi:hypothetical protein